MGELSDAVKDIKPLNADVYMLTLKSRPPYEKELNDFRKKWKELCRQSGRSMQVICLPDSYELNPIKLNGRTFDFSTVLKLLKIGHKVARHGWLNTYDDVSCWLVLKGDVIHMIWSDRDPEIWKQTQFDILAEDYVLKS